MDETLELKKPYSSLLDNCDFMPSETEQGIFEQVLKGELDFSSEPWPGISESAKDLIRKMLVRNPKRRLTAHQVLCKCILCGTR